MTASTDLIAPVKGLVFEHAKRTNYDGTPRAYTVTSVRQGLVHYRDSLGLKNKCKAEQWERVVGQVVSVPGPAEVDSSPTFTDAQAQALHNKAHAAGMAAGEAAMPTPMIVVQRANPLDDTSPIVKEYAPVMEGVCGFAYVTVRPGTSSFARWLRRRGRGYTAYYGGTAFSVRQFGQSMTRKAAYADAYASVLREAGIKAYSESRMD